MGDESDRNELPENQISARMDRALRRMIDTPPQPKRGSAAKGKLRQDAKEKGRPSARGRASKP